MYLSLNEITLNVKMIMHYSLPADRHCIYIELYGKLIFPLHSA